MESLPLYPIIDLSMESSREGWSAGLLKILDQGIKEGSDLEQGVVTWLTFLDILAVVIQVQELQVSLDDLTVNSYLLPVMRKRTIQDFL